MVPSHTAKAEPQARQQVQAGRGENEEYKQEKSNGRSSRLPYRTKTPAKTTAVREANQGAAWIRRDEAPLLATEPACAAACVVALDRAVEDMLPTVDITRVFVEVREDVELEEVEMLEVLEVLVEDDEVEETVDEVLGDCWPAWTTPEAKLVEPYSAAPSTLEQELVAGAG
jgi:hypothetical protein